MRSETSLGPLLALFTDLSPGSTTAAAPTRYTLAMGTPVDAALTDVISSRHATAGEPFTARVAGGAVRAAVSVNLKDRDIVLPAGAHLMLTLRQPLTVAAR